MFIHASNQEELSNTKLHIYVELGLYSVRLESFNVLVAFEKPLIKPDPDWNKPMNILRIVLAIFIPPVAAFLTVGFGLHFWLNILLTIFFVLPGVVHALWLVVKKAEDA